MLLMTAMASGPETTEFNGFFRRLFSFGGCSGSVSRGTACTGSRSSSPYGACSGRTSAQASSCCGSYARSPSSCCGSSAYASCSGGMVPSYQMPNTTPYYAPPSPTMYYVAPSETSGCFGSGGGGYVEPAADAPLAPLAQPQPATPRIPPTSIDMNGVSRSNFAANPSERGTVVVRLPVDAVLYAEGRRLALSGAEREFVTPPLPPGEYPYTFKVEYARGGETLTRSRQIVVRPGGSVVVDFAEAQTVGAVAPVPSVPAPDELGPNSVKADAADKPELASTKRPAAKPLAPAKSAEPEGKSARIVVKLPPGAALSVDGRRQERPDAVRQFETPPIAPGEAFTYTLRVDWPGGGKVTTQSEKVTVRGGDAREVDFTNWMRVGG